MNAFSPDRARRNMYHLQLAHNVDPDKVVFVIGTMDTRNESSLVNVTSHSGHATSMYVLVIVCVVSSDLKC